MPGHTAFASDGRWSGPPTLRQKSETVSPLARSRSASLTNRVTSSSVRRLSGGPSRFKFTEGLPFQVDQLSGGSPHNTVDQRLRITLIGFVNHGGQHQVAREVDHVFGLVRQVCPAILHVRDPALRVGRRHPLLVGNFDTSR